VENVSGNTKVSGNLEENGSYQFVREVETTHGTIRQYNAFVDISEMDDIRGHVEDHQFGVRRPGVIKVDGLDFPIETDGTFDLQVTPKASHEVKARQYDSGNPYSFIRTVDVPGYADSTGMRVAVVDYTGLTSDTAGVTPE
jgi:deferrochelatase/peroxidase EfeB